MTNVPISFIYSHGTWDVNGLSRSLMLIKLRFHYNTITCETVKCLAALKGQLSHCDVPAVEEWNKPKVVTLLLVGFEPRESLQDVDPDKSLISK